MPPTPGRPPNNRIQVDLKLLQDKNLDLLRQFADRFEENVNKLSEVAARMEDALGKETRTGPGKIGEDASVAPTLEMRARQGGLPYNTGTVGGWPIPEELRAMQGQASVVSPSHGPEPITTETPKKNPSFMQRQGYGPLSGEPLTEYERAQFRLGALGEGMIPALQYVSYLTGEETGFLGNHPTVSGYFGGAARAGIYANQARQMFSRARGMVPFGLSDPFGSAQYGVGLGY